MKQGIGFLYGIVFVTAVYFAAHVYHGNEAKQAQAFDYERQHAAQNAEVKDKYDALAEANNVK
jgi:hypothetical protein